jgi:hypothetical protein
VDRCPAVFAHMTGLEGNPRLTHAHSVLYCAAAVLCQALATAVDLSTAAGDALPVVLIAAKDDLGMASVSFLFGGSGGGRRACEGEQRREGQDWRSFRDYLCGAIRRGVGCKGEAGSPGGEGAGKVQRT